MQPRLTSGQVRVSRPGLGSGCHASQAHNPPPRPREVHCRVTPSPGPDLSLTFQVLFLAQEAAGGCHGDSLWVSAKDAGASSQPPQPAPAPRGPRPGARGGLGISGRGEGQGLACAAPPQDTPGRGQHSQANQTQRRRAVRRIPGTLGAGHYRPSLQREHVCVSGLAAQAAWSRDSPRHQ